MCITLMQWLGIRTLLSKKIRKNPKENYKMRCHGRNENRVRKTERKFKFSIGRSSGESLLWMDWSRGLVESVYFYSHVAAVTIAFLTLSCHGQPVLRCSKNHETDLFFKVNTEITLFIQSIISSLARGFVTHTVLRIFFDVF